MKKKLLFLVLLMGSTIIWPQVGIGTDTPDPSSALEVQSTTKGFLFPRMSESQMNAIASPVEGLLVYCTDCSPKGAYLYNGFVFESMITHLPSNVTVGTDEVYSPTGKVWMDRNLGASQVATSSTDALAYGDLYQWGRTSDGHEDRLSSTAPGPVPSGSEGSDFITNSTSDPTASDWLTPLDVTRWNSGTEGTPVKTAHDPCPSGYRIPTKTEFDNEILTWPNPGSNPGAYNESPLQLTLTGYRAKNGVVGAEGQSGGYWTSTNFAAISTSYHLSIGTISPAVGATTNVQGRSVRCIKE